MAWTSLMEEALDRLEDAEHRLGRDPAAHLAATRAFAQARNDIRSALEAAKGEAADERAAVRDQLERDTKILRREFDAERRELREALDNEGEKAAEGRAELGAEPAREREHHDVELAQAFRRHAIAMEKDRQRLAEDAGHLVERQTSHLKRTIERAISDLDSVNVKWLPLADD